MKASILYTILFFISIDIFSQKPDNLISLEDSLFNGYFFNDNNIPIVKGKILNFKESSDNTWINYTTVNPLPIFKYLKNGSVKINKDGTFEIELRHAFPYQQIFIDIEDIFYGIVYANSELYIELDLNIIKNYGKANYVGKGLRYLNSDGELNNYINNYYLFKREQKNLITSELVQIRNKKLPIDLYISKYDSLFAVMHKIDQEFIDNNPIEFSWLINNETLSEYYAGLLCSEYWGQKIDDEHWNKIINHKSYLVSNKGESYYNYLLSYIKDGMNKKNKKRNHVFDNDSVTHEFSVIIDFGIGEKIKDTIQLFDTLKESLIDNSHEVKINKTMKTLDSIFLRPKADFLKTLMYETSINDQKKLMEYQCKNITTDWCKNYITSIENDNNNKLNLIKDILSDKTPHSSISEIGYMVDEYNFGAILYLVDSINAKTFLNNLVNFFNGKALIIDFWATWCSPCLFDMKFGKSIHDKASDLPVEFIYLCSSVNSNIDDWKTWIEKLEQPGIHFFVKKEIMYELMYIFDLTAFPNYVFIDNDRVYKPGVISRMEFFDINMLKKMINQ